MKWIASPYSRRGTYNLEQFLQRFRNNPSKKIYYTGEEHGIHKFGIDSSTSMVTLPSELYSALGSPRINQQVSLSQILQVINPNPSEGIAPVKTS